LIALYRRRRMEIGGDMSKRKGGSSWQVSVGGGGGTGDGWGLFVRAGKGRQERRYIRA